MKKVQSRLKENKEIYSNINEIKEELKDFESNICDFIGDLTENLANELAELINVEISEDFEEDGKTFPNNNVFCVKRLHS